MSKYKCEIEIPKCFIKLVEYVYRMPYNKVIDSMHTDQIEDELYYIFEHRESVKQKPDVDKFRIYEVQIDKIDNKYSYSNMLIFQFLVTSEFRLGFRTCSPDSLVTSGIISWMLEQGYDILEALFHFNMKYLASHDRLTPYMAIPYIVQYHNIDALDALCTYADGEKNFICLLDELDKVSAVEEKMVAIRFAHEHNLNITQNVKLEL